MKYSILLFCSFFVIMISSTQATDFQLPSSGDCPDIDTLDENKVWVEHEVWTSDFDTILDVHLQLPLDRAFITFFSVDVENSSLGSYWLGSVARTNQNENKYLYNPGCYVIGTVATYADAWPPQIDLVKEVESGNEKDLFVTNKIEMIELRWYDHRDQRRHRWFNRDLAIKLGWKIDNNPIRLPLTINSLY